MIETVLSVIFGAVVSLLVAHFYHVQAGKDLRRVVDELRGETDRLRRLTEIAVGGLASAGLVEVVYGEDGEIRRLITLSGVGRASPATGAGPGGIFVSPASSSSED